jgi:hypothetical protein
MTISASVLSLVWMGLAFGWIPLPGDADGKGRLVLIVAIDLILFILGVIALIRAMRRHQSWLIASVIILVPIVHWIGSAVAGEASILFFLVPGILLIAVTCIQQRWNALMQRRHALR